VKEHELTAQIPDDLARRMSASSGGLSRRALEALALEEFKSDYLTKPELRRLLGGTFAKPESFHLLRGLKHCLRCGPQTRRNITSGNWA
jgi:hypothetical protein